MSNQQFPELNVLKTSKTALDEGYISADDYDVVKLAFLKAQQIKAGVDAGFLREEDYERTRDAFLHSLDFTIHVVQTNKPSDGSAKPTTPVATTPAATTPNGAINKPSLPKVPAPAANTHRTSGLSAPSPRASPAPSNTSGPFNQASSPTQPAAPTQRVTGGTVPVDMTKVPKVVQSVPGQAMSGISVSVDCVNIFNFIKTRSSNKWVTFKIDDAGHQVVIEQLGAPDSAFEDFVDAFPEDQCKYGVFDCTYAREGGVRIQKLVFFHWAPDTAQIRTKMMYASTKEFLKGLLSGIAAEVQVNDKKEFTMQLVNDRIYDTLTRK